MRRLNDSRSGPAVIELQAPLIDAIEAYTGSGGTADAYVTSAAEPDINADTLTSVGNYVPDHGGDNFMAQVTVGQATLADLEANAFGRVTIHPAGSAIYHLGNNGTAQTQLHHWDLT